MTAMPTDPESGDTEMPTNVEHSDADGHDAGELANDAIAAVQPPRRVLSRSTEQSLKNAITSARVCVDFRGEEVFVLDLTEITPEFDYFVIATAGSRRQMHAIVDEVDHVLDHAGFKRRSIEGYDTTPWIVQDYGDVVLHVFLPDARELYDLESLWGDAKKIDWETIEAAAAAE